MSTIRFERVISCYVEQRLDIDKIIGGFLCFSIVVFLLYLQFLELVFWQIIFLVFTALIFVLWCVCTYKDLRCFKRVLVLFDVGLVEIRKDGYVFFKLTDIDSISFVRSSSFRGYTIRNMHLKLKNKSFFDIDITDMQLDENEFEQRLKLIGFPKVPINLENKLI